MSYQIGQFRRPQMSSYYDEIDEEYITQGLKQTDVQYGDTQSLVFQNPCITLSNSGILTSQNFYYLRFKVKRRNDSIQRFYLKLQNSNDSEESDQQQQQIIDEFKVEQGEGYTYFETIIAPNTTYDQIVWQLRRTILDYSIQEDATENIRVGRIMQIEIENYAKIKNVIDFLQQNYTNLKGLAKIGVQGPPSLLMCINGEQIRIGKSGIYELNNGIAVSFIGFIPKESTTSSDGLDYFIMDFEY